jgi:ParB family chromosome partitioning protein
MAGRKSDFTLTKLDDLFTTQEQRDDEKLSKIRDRALRDTRLRSAAILI